MKAKEYFEKYEKTFLEDDEEKAMTGLSDLVKELSKEVKVIYEKRGGKSTTALVAVIKELNQKWNAISALFEKKYGATPLKHNGYLNYLRNEIPEIDRYI